MPIAKEETISEIEKMLARLRKPREPKPVTEEPKVLPKPEVEETKGLEPIPGLWERLERGQTVILTPEVAKGMGMELDFPEDWMMKITPPKNGEQPAFSYISPEGKEVLPEDTRETPEGKWLTMQQSEVFEAERVERARVETEEITFLFKGLYPEFFEPHPEEAHAGLTGQYVSQLIESPELQEQFFEDVYSKGRTPEMERMLTMLLPEVTEKDLTRFFGRVEVDETPVAITEEGYSVQMPLWERAWKSLYSGIRTGVTQAAQAVFSVILPSMFPYVREGESKVTGMSDEKAQKEGFAYTAEEAAWTNQRMEPWRAKFREVAVDLQSQHENWLKKHPELKPPPEYEQDIFENPELLKDPGYLIHTMMQTIGIMLPSLVTGVAVGFTTKKPWTGALVTATTMTPMEMQGLYDDLIEHGAPVERAEELALTIGAAIGAVEIAPGMIFMKAVFPVFKSFRRGLQKEIVKATMRHMIAKGVKNFTAIEISEALEEVLQGVIADYTVSFYDENRDILAAIPSTIIQTLIGVTPLAMFGGGMSMRQVKPEEADAVPENQKEIEGWEKNKFTGEWRKPEKMVDTYNEIVNEGKTEGLSDNQAKLQALNEIARTPEGEAAISEATGKVEKGVPVVEKPVVPPAKPPVEIKPPVAPEVEGRRFIGITKSTEPTQARTPWRVAYERGGKEYAYHVSSKAKALQYAKDKLGVELDTETLEPVTPEVTEPWQMSKGDFSRKALRDAFPEGSADGKAFEELTDQQAIATADGYFLKPSGVHDHEYFVRKALSEGKPVPPEVLKDYPELAKVKPKPPVIEAPPPAKPLVPEVVPEADVEVRRQLGELSKMADIWSKKLATSEQTKVSLARYVRENLPINVRGRYITSVARVKTDAQLQAQIIRVQEFAELNAQKVLKGEVRKELKRTQAVVKDHILKGKFTPDTQIRLDTISHNLELDRDTAREKMADNIAKYDNGELSYEEMLKTNEALNFAGIDGMSSGELADTLEYIKILKLLGRSERQAKQEAATEKIKATRAGIGGILTGGKGLKEGVGAVPRKQLAAKPNWLDGFVNWQYSLDNLADKLSKLDPTSKPYQSEISEFVAQAHRATARQAVATRDAYNEVKGIVQEVYGVKSNHDVNQVLNGLGEEVNLGVFEFTEEYKANNPEATTINIRMTRDEMIAKYMQMQDSTLDNTFTTGMGWSQEVRDTVENTLTAEEKKLVESIFQFYEEGYVSINEIYTELYNVNMPHNPNYSPIRRDLEGDIAENVLTFQDAQQYAAVTAQSIKARIKNIRPLRFNGATQLLSNHIDQMEHFKAWATTMRDFRRVFGNTEIRQAIEQYHGVGISKRLDTFLSQMARDGVETAATNRTADLLRRNFTKSILAIKPVVGLKQIPSLFAYISEMNVTEFVGGVADYWSSPIANFKFLYANSEGYRARVSQGFERDIRAATAKHGVNKISGRGGFVDWFLLQIRLADTFAVTQGMWAKYKVGLKGGLSQAEAIAAAEDTTNRTQPSFGIDTLSSIQNGGSWFKLMTMFQNQPNKYFRIVGDNLRNFKYGRGSRVKAAETLLLAWVVLPMMFQFIADAFQWKPERQLRAGLLGPLNFILIGGQLVQSVWGWLTDLPFDYQISPVAQTLRDLQTIVNKAKKLVAQGIDPYKDISMDDVASLVEYLAKATGQVTGLPTPYFVQVSRGIREKLAEDEDIDIKDFLFSQWALEPPEKGAEEKVEEANLKLGEIKEGQEDRPLTGKELKIFTTVDWLREIGKVFKNVLPQDVLTDKNASKESKAWAQYETARSKADILPNTSLHKINTEDNDDTIINYYEQWKAREKITSLAELNEYDKLYPKARLGNVTRQQYSDLTKYLEAEDKDAFLESHPNLKVNPRNEWLRENPTDNAILAVGGQAKILSIEAYNEFNRLVKELDLPDDAIPEQTLPPGGSVENYFKYNEMVEEFSANSWEVQLILAQDNDLREFLGRQPVTTSIEALELKIASRDLDPESQEYKDNGARIEAISKDGSEFQDKWVERGQTVDEFGGGSSEAKVWLLDNPTVHKWALDAELLTDDGSDWDENVLRLNVEMAKLEEESEEYKRLALEKRAYQTVPDGMVSRYLEYYNLPLTGYRRERYLLENPEFTKEVGLKAPGRIPSVKYDELLEKAYKTPEDLIRMKGYKLFVPEKYIDRFAEFDSIRAEGKPSDYPEGIRYYGDEWYLFDHPLFYKDIYRGLLGLDEVNFENVPTPEQRRVYTKRVFDLYETLKGLEQGSARREFEAANPDLDLFMHLEFGTMLESERAKVEPKKEVKEPTEKKEGETARERILRELAEMQERLKR